jgi:hypothetical protein
MKIALLALIIGCFIVSNRRKASLSPASSPAGEQHAALAKAPDCDKPEQFLWQLMFGSVNGSQSILLKFAAAVVFVGAQIALEILKSK